jgi:hypothetical protein
MKMVLQLLLRCAKFVNAPRDLPEPNAQIAMTAVVDVVIATTVAAMTAAVTAKVAIAIVIAKTAIEVAAKNARS